MLWQITPALPPRIDGVGDYAVGLAQALRECGITSGFITQGDGSGEIGGLPVERLAQRTAAALHATLDGCGARTVLLHASGYGYAPRALCWWLSDGLRRWKEQQGDRRLVTAFHELYAMGPPWRASFWTTLPQRKIAYDLATLSAAAAATTQRTAEKLGKWCPELPVVVTPVFSNVGELTAPSPLRDREPTAIVFGQRRQREAAYAALAKSPAAVAEGLRRVGVGRILDIGPPASTPVAIGGLPVELMGPLDPEVISGRLASARVGLVDYPLHGITKSGIMAAYFAHGLLTVNTSTVGRLPDDMCEGREFAHPDRLSDPSLNPQSIAANGFEWYRRHDRAGVAAVMSQLIA